ncbi:PKD domain-containing protein [Aquiflexum sp.]|uniref:PKD domain-containing protein n=1 Tax=Aquiflexum sp. TaxID=1872584 RepID=UPI0035941B25
MIRKLFFTASGILLFCSVTAQNYVGPSPNSMGIVRLANQVSHYTGSPGINIPLASISGKELGVSVSLSYNSFGHRVQDVASSVGLGWNLMAGGMITRVVKGLPDDLTGGYCKPNPTDEEPDVYTFAINGMSGKFVLDKNGIPVLMPFQDILIKPGICKTSPDGQWEIIDQNGTRYIFGSTAASRETTTYRKVIEGIGSTKTITSTWLLERIISANGTDEIFFSYLYGNHTIYNYSYYKDNGPDVKLENDNILKNETLEMTQSIRDPFLISTSSGSILFNYSTNREDLYGGKSLESIIVRDHLNAVVSKTFLKYNYFSSSGCKRLKLDAIYDLGTEPLYGFIYETSINLPCTDSKNIDYLGLYNDNTVNDWIPAYPTTEWALFGASREPSTTRMKANLIKSISLRGGATIEYIFEPHKGLHNGTEKIVSGNRIKEIKSNDGSGNFQIVQYIYDHVNQSTGIVPRIPTMTLAVIQNKKKVWRRFSHPIGEIFDLNGSFIGYSRVEERIQGKGKIVHFYTNYNSNMDLYSFDGLFTSSTKFWERGLPIAIGVYSELGTMVTHESMQYNFSHPNLRTISATEKITVPIENSDPKVFQNDYTFVSKALTLSSKINTSYGTENQNNGIITNEVYAYSPGTYQLVSTTFSNSSHPDQKIIKNLKYVNHWDYVYQNYDCQQQFYSCLDGCINSSDPYCESNCQTQYENCVTNAIVDMDSFSKAVYRLREKRIHSAVIESQTFMEKTGVRNLLEAQVIRYQILGEDNKVLPHSELISKKNLSTSYTGSKINSSGVFELPTSFVEVASYSFDPATGKMLSTNSRDGTVTSYTYSNNNTTVASSTTNPGTLEFKTSYVYKPLIGPIQEKDPNNRNVNMEYDGLGRLRLVKDHNNDIRERYRYHYRNETPNFKIVANPAQVLVGQSVTFSLEDILVPTGGTFTRHWNTGNGTQYTDNRTTMTHSYPLSGLYTVSATLFTNEYGPVIRQYSLLVSNPLNITVCADGPQEKDLCNPANRVWGSCTASQVDFGYTRFRTSFSSPTSTGCTGIYNYDFQYRLAGGTWISFANGPQDYGDFLHSSFAHGYYYIRCIITDTCSNTAIASSYINIYKSNPNCTPIDY